MDFFVGTVQARAGLDAAAGPGMALALGTASRAGWAAATSSTPGVVPRGDLERPRRHWQGGDGAAPRLMNRLLNVHRYRFRKGGAEAVYLDQWSCSASRGWTCAEFVMAHPRNEPVRVDRATSPPI